jgi:hypothetical protein
VIARGAHLVTRFFRSLRARPLDAETAAWVDGLLEPGERNVWAGMSRADQAEGVAVARAFRDTSTDDEPRWLAAALLHDAGKQVSGFGTFGRVYATTVTVVVGKARVREWADLPGRLRPRVGWYAAHDDLGAELLRTAGARPEVAAWAAAHHRPHRWAGTEIPAAVCRALAEADGER